MSEEAAAAIGDIAYWQRRAEAAEADAARLSDSCQAWVESEARWRTRANAAEAEAAALRRLAIAHRNLSMQLAVPGSEHWQEVMRDLQAAETALYAAAERPGAGQTLLAQLTRAEGLATAATIALHELTESGSVQEHTRSLLQAAVDAFEAGSKEST